MIQRVGQSSSAQLTSIQALIEGLVACDQIEPMVDCALQFLQSELDYPLLWIAAYDAKRSELSGLGGRLPQLDASALSRCYSVLPGDLFDQTLLTGHPTEVMNLQEEGRAGKWQKLGQRLGIQGAILYPILYRQKCLGLLLLGSSHWGRNPRTTENSVLSIFSRAFGAALHQLQYQTVAPASAESSPLLTLVNQISTLLDEEDRLHVILKTAHQMINPTFMGLYWIDYEESICVLKSCFQPGQGKGRIRPLKAQVQLSAIDSCCHVLSSGQMVSVSDSQGAVNTKVPLRLMQQTKSRSLLCAPIMAKGQLLGFLSAEGADPRVWQEQDKTFLQAAAQLVGLSVTSANQQSLQTLPTHTLMGQFTQWMVESKDWPKTLKKVGEHLCRHLQAQRLVLLQQDAQTGEFRVEFQYHSPKLHPLLEALHPLSDVDMGMLERNIGALSITNLEEDLRFLAWRESLMNQGLRSCLICRTLTDRKAPLTLLLLGNHRTKTWQPNEVEFLQQFAQALGRFEQKQRDFFQQQHQLKLHTLAQEALSSIQAIDAPMQVISTGVNVIAEMFAPPLVASIVWIPGQLQGKIVDYQAASASSISDRSPIQLSQDPLLSELLALPANPSSPVPLIKAAATELAPQTKRWLSSPGLDTVWVFGLRSQNSPTLLGAIVMGTSLETRLRAFDLTQIQTLIQQLAHRYRTLKETRLFQHKWSESESLHWIKQRSFEQKAEQIQNNLSTLQTSETPEINKQSLNSLQETIDALTTLFKAEDWQLNLEPTSFPLASLVRRAMARIAPVVQASQLWTQVHNLTSNIILQGTSDKIELVLYELLLAACHRSQPKHRIDIWCRLINSEWVELSITDQGQLHHQLIQDFQTEQLRDLLIPNHLDQIPGMHYKMCQSLIKQLGGRMELAQLEDGRILSRLTLPIQSAS